jgi:hypothetical protein
MPEGEIFHSRAKGVTVRVTNKGVTIDDVTYPFMKSAAVFSQVETPSRIGPLLVTAVGVIFCVERSMEAALGTAILAGAVAAVGVICLKECKPIYCIDLAAVCSDHAPVLRGGEKWIGAIANAINEAIANQTENRNVPEMPFLVEPEAPAPSIQIL